MKLNSAQYQVLMRILGWTICRFYVINLCFRHNKQYTGITNCQLTDFRKLTFHFNASLIAVNLAKITCFF